MFTIYIEWKMSFYFSKFQKIQGPMFLKYILLEVKLPYDPMYYLSATFLCPQNMYSQKVVSPLKKINW